ncbi:MAG: adenylate/guanylate cyclase domain-containing protein [Actinomycetota bacterium]
METPDTRYARVDGLRIAFQQFGAGEPVIIIPPLVTNADSSWEHEYYRRMLEHLGAQLHVVHFDKRGIGLSDRFEQIPTLDDRINDITGVLDTVGWDSAHVLGVSEGGVMAQHFAVRHPDRVRKLVLLGTSAPPQHGARIEELSGEHWRPVEDLIADFAAIGETWGEDPMPFVQLMAPSQIDNEAYCRWIIRHNRQAASPADFERQVRSVARLSAGAHPEQITNSTLIVHLLDDQVFPVGHARLLNELIPDAQLIEVPGADHVVATLANWRDVFDPIIEFITGTRPPQSTARRFGVVLFTDIVGSTQLASSLGDDEWRQTLERHDRAAHQTVDSHRGRVVKSTGDGILALFEAPSAAVEAARALRDELAPIGLAIRAGLHAGEIEQHADGDISGLGVNLAARIEQTAENGEILVSSTIKDMLLGSGLILGDRGQHQLKGIDGDWQLFAVGPSS